MLLAQQLATVQNGSLFRSCHGCRRLPWGASACLVARWRFNPPSEGPWPGSNPERGSIHCVLLGCALIPALVRPHALTHPAFFCFVPVDGTDGELVPNITEADGLKEFQTLLELERRIDTSRTNSDKGPLGRGPPTWMAPHHPAVMPVFSHPRPFSKAIRPTTSSNANEVNPKEDLSSIHSDGSVRAAILFIGAVTWSRRLRVGLPPHRWLLRCDQRTPGPFSPWTFQFSTWNTTDAYSIILRSR